MAKEITFVQGLYCKKKVFENGGSLTEIDFNMEEFLAFARQYTVNGQLNLSLQTSKGGKLYAKVNDFRRDYAIQQQQANQAPQQEAQPQYQQPQYQQPQQTQSQPAYQAPTGNPHQPTQAQVDSMPNFDEDDLTDDVPF